MTPATIRDWLLDTFNNQLDADSDRLNQTAALLSDIWQVGPADMVMSSWNDPSHPENPRLNQINIFWQPVKDARAQLTIGKELKTHPNLDIRDFPFQSMDYSLRDWVYRLPFAGSAARANSDWVKGEWPVFPEKSLAYQVKIPLGPRVLVFDETIGSPNLDTDLRIGQGFRLSHIKVAVE